MNLTENNFILFAANNYNNMCCDDEKEFLDDLNRIRYLKKMFTVYEKTGEININLVLNHIIIIFNVFGVEAGNKLMFFKLRQYWHVLKSIILPLGHIPHWIKFSDVDIVNIKDVPIDKFIFEKIKKIVNDKPDH